jgi:hypothetical protein
MSNETSDGALCSDCRASETGWCGRHLNASSLWKPNEDEREVQRLREELGAIRILVDVLPCFCAGAVPLRRVQARRCSEGEQQRHSRGGDSCASKSALCSARRSSGCCARDLGDWLLCVLQAGHEGRCRAAIVRTWRANRGERSVKR